MADKKGKGKKEHKAPPKVCPRPADFRNFPELQALVVQEYRARMEYCTRWKKQKK